MVVRVPFVVCVVVAALASGCSCGTSIGEEERFACSSDRECGEDYRCFAGGCLRVDDPVFNVCSPEVCDDGADNDCDGKVDCQDEDCCGVCGTCELSCGDGVDNDLDGLTDCADPDCEGRSCGTHGRVCNGGGCFCPSGQQTELSCGDGVDNDCDGLVDCADPDCGGQSCGANGRVCAGGVCTCPGGEATETSCGDGVDNDCDGLVDCADPDCARRPCSAASATSVCCSVGTATAACVDLTTNRTHCGGCGIACSGSRECVAVPTATGVHGACGCTQTNHCRTGSVCVGGQHCACTAAGQCAASQSCTGDTSTPGYCAYP